MSTFLFGASSMLGWSILQARRGELTAFANELTRALPGIGGGIDLDNERAVVELFARTQPSLIIHCAGVCDVEKCEQSPAFAKLVNVEGTRLLLEHAPPSARIVYCSSDHVFSGDTGPYDESSPPDPLTVYGRTRVAAERLVLARDNTIVIRAGLWIGPSASGKNGHLDWLRYRTRHGLPMTVVEDEARSPMWADEAAERVWQLAASSITGLRHVTATQTRYRPEIATYLDAKFQIGARFTTQTRASRRTPHLGRVELRTIHGDELARPLRSVIES